ncbi:MAG TPA: hypothetical protein VGG72_26790 [Bryobacteraceae bacterium]|jgi:hypothetical protein
MRLTLSAFLFALLSFASFARAGEVTSESPAQSAPVAASWKLSLAPLLASQGLDAASSYGKRELNPLLAGPQGQFGVSSVVIKVGVTSGLIGVEYLIVKAHPAAARFFTKINWAAAGVTAGIAAHNFTIH